MPSLTRVRSRFGVSQRWALRMVEQPRWVQGQATEICGRFLGRTVACLAENVVSCFRLRKVFLDGSSVPNIQRSLGILLLHVLLRNLWLCSDLNIYCLGDVARTVHLCLAVRLFGHDVQNNRRGIAFLLVARSRLGWVSTKRWTCSRFCFAF